MDTKRRVGGSTLSIAWIAGFGREFFASRPHGKSLAWLWDMISPQSFYLSMTIIGFGGLLYFCWPAGALVKSHYINWRDRKKIEAEKIKQKELQVKSDAIKLIKPFLILHHDELFHIRPAPEQRVQAEELKQRLLPIRLTPMTATCRVPPLSRVKLGIGWSRGVARDAEQ